MAFEKKYAEPDEEWQPITTEKFHEEIGNYWKDPVAVGIELIAETGQSIRAPFASYRFVDDSTPETCATCNGSGRDPEGEHYEGSASSRCPRCNGTGEKTCDCCSMPLDLCMCGDPI